MKIILKPHAGIPLLLIALLSGCDKSKVPDSAAPPADVVTSTSKAGPQAVEKGATPAEMSVDESRLPLIAGKSCNLERANGTPFTGEPVTVSKAAEIITLSGWLADVDLNSVPPEAYLRLVNAESKRIWKVGVKIGGKRDDVMALLGGDATFANSGFSVVLDVGGLPAGVYRTYVVFPSGGKLKSCDNGRTVVITE